ncbi:MAG: WD40 repeat domain-containing protein [Myxococcota bacterium]|nr:WD40 repeat domain-containing protein [Deltaproteobacteria bacterium]MDQ3338375.1 WD40 repeat domain-containing protein [Myxococcota bacterium]
MTHDKTLVLAGAKPKRVRLRVVKTTLEQTTWNAKGTAKVTKKSFAKAEEAAREFDKAVRKKLRDDYAVLGEAAEPGDIILEAFAPGGGGGAVLDMSMDGSMIVTASITSESSFGAKLEMVEVASGARHVVVDEPGGSRQNFLHTALFARDGKSIYFVLRDDTYRVELATGKRTRIATGDPAALNPFVTMPTFDLERRRLVVLAKGPCVRVIDENHATVLEVSTKSKTTECRGAQISASGRLLALYISSRGIIYGHDDAKSDTTNEIQVWDIEAGVKWETVTLAEKVDDVGFAPADDLLLVTYEYARGPVALEIPSGRERWRIVDPHDESSLARASAWTYSPDGKSLAVAGDSLRLLDAKTRAPIVELPRVFGRVACPVFSRDGKRLAVSIGGTAIVHAL